MANMETRTPTTDPVPAIENSETAPSRSQGRRWAVAALIVLAFITPFILSDYHDSQLALVFALAVAVLGLNLLTGYAGLISVGHGALMGIGGYTTVGLAVNLGVPYPVGLLAGMVLCALAGFVLGLPSLRLSGLYLALVTIGFAIVFPSLIKRFEGITGGVSGLTFMTPDAPFGIPLSSAQWVYLLTLTVFLLAVVAVRNLVTGRVGRALDAIRQNELMAASNGIAVGRLKLTVFAVSSAIAGLAGGLYQLVVGSALPDTYVVTFSITLLTAAVVGGVRSIAGAIIGAAFIVYVPDYAAAVGDRGPQLVYAIALLVIVYLARNGVAGAVSSLWRKVTASRS